MNGSRYFVMAAIITRRSRFLLQPSKLIRNDKYEMKFHDSIEKDKTAILSSISKTNSNVVYVAVDKWDYKSDYYNLSGNDLYLCALNKLIQSISAIYHNCDTKIMIDESRQISSKELSNISKTSSMNIISFKKYTSSSNKCVQIADYVAGSVFAKYEHGNDFFYNIIEKNVLRP